MEPPLQQSNGNLVREQLIKVALTGFQIRDKI